jgi:hypothetical protein
MAGWVGSRVQCKAEEKEEEIRGEGLGRTSRLRRVGETILHGEWYGDFEPTTDVMTVHWRQCRLERDPASTLSTE